MNVFGESRGAAGAQGAPLRVLLNSSQFFDRQPGRAAVVSVHRVAQLTVDFRENAKLGGADLGVHQVISVVYVWVMYEHQHVR